MLQQTITPFATQQAIARSFAPIDSAAFIRRTRTMLRTVTLLALCWASSFGTAAAQSPAPLEFPDLDIRQNGTVYTIARQPDGGIVIGGEFTEVAGVPRSNIARLKADGSLDEVWNPSATYAVHALAVSGNAVYVGGYNYIAGQYRHGLAKLRGDGNGAADPSWADPAVNGNVLTVAADANAVYVGGRFTQADGQPRHNLAKFSAHAGTLDSTWNPEVIGFTGAQVNALVLSGEHIFIGGYFNQIAQNAHLGLAKLSTVTGIPDGSWSAEFQGNPYVSTLATDGPSLYVGGGFQSINGQTRINLAKLSTATGTLDNGWNPAPNDSVVTLAVADGAVYAGGYFNQIGGVPRRGLARLSATTGTIGSTWTPQPAAGSLIQVLAVYDNTVYVGGAFARIDGQSRFGLAAINSNDGQSQGFDVESRVVVRALARQADGGLIFGGTFAEVNGYSRIALARLLPDGQFDTAWDAQITGIPGSTPYISALEASSNAIFIGGFFLTIQGIERPALAKLNSSGNLDISWNPTINCSQVYALALSNDSLYAGGCFTSVGGLVRNRLAKLSAASGAVDANWNPSVNNSISTLAISSDALYVGGNFTTVGGLARSRIAKLELSGSGGVDVHWAPAANGEVYSLSLVGSSIYAGGDFSEMGGLPRTFVAKLSTIGSGTVDPDWSPAINGPALSVVQDNDDVILGGYFSHIGSAYRPGLAKLSATNAVLDPAWNPSANNFVRTLLLDNDTLLVGGYFTGIGNEPRTALAALPKDAPPVSCASTDITPVMFDLTFTPESPYGRSFYNVVYENTGATETNTMILVYFYELDASHNRVRLVEQRTHDRNLSPGQRSGLGGPSNEIKEGTIYEAHVDYPCDTNANNKSIFQFAYNSVSPDVVFRAGMESPPVLPLQQRE